MSLKTLSLLLALPLAAAACTAPADEAPAPALTHWQDVPVPRGFEPVEVAAAPAALQIGEFRHGALRYEGLGNVEALQEYYQDRLPDHGWEPDLARGGWKKGPHHLEVTISRAPKKSSEAFQKVWIDLWMRSERTPPPTR